MYEDDMSIRREVILVIVILTAAAIFFLAGLVHVIFRLLAKTHSSPSSSPPPPPATFRQRQLRQLFRLHDDSVVAGLDRAVVEALPWFCFDDLRNCPSNKQPFDCPVCLCQFSARDELRLLPGCGHAFHVSCVDTWLLTNATCPLCRRALFAGDVAMPCFEDDDDMQSRVFSVRLGKFESSSSGCEGETSGCDNNNNNNKLDDRRCYSMGTFRYVVGESDLRVTSSRYFGAQSGNKKIGTREKGESFSVSKIWLRLPGCSDTDIQAPVPANTTVRGVFRVSMS